MGGRKMPRKMKKLYKKKYGWSWCSVYQYQLICDKVHKAYENNYSAFDNPRPYKDLINIVSKRASFDIQKARKNGEVLHTRNK
jgi:hypothetical protein